MENPLRTYSSIIRSAFLLFLKNDPLKLGGATAFFTMFALPPVLIILVQLLSLFLDPHTIRHEMFTSLSGMVGEEAVRQIISVIKAVRKLNSNWPATILVFIFLLFVATTVFRVIRSSINQIWDVEMSAGKKVIHSLRSRLLSLVLIVITGILFSIGIVFETVQVVIGNYFIQIFPSLSGWFNQFLAFIIAVLIIAIWFTIILRYLNDRHPSWRIARAGGLFTSILFYIGKTVLHILLNYNSINNIYGASTSVILVLLFVFYSAMILYFGAAFTKVWGISRENK